MELQKVQEIVENWIKEHGVRYFDELTNMAQLTEEVGRLPVSLPEGMESKVKKRVTRQKTWGRNSPMLSLL